ncbi:hypothetical protein C8F04DRAFT_1228269 [Mycena alexandri]|uniref:Uncharacterized protein n=1 Tax=Mycena alexandri TaxID=1745969 RepID=A0AAD6THA8_9AGAR|nr:hypothetical protein C8F04DRAFT_1228269 [Mycena alexandri]
MHKPNRNCGIRNFATRLEGDSFSWWGVYGSRSTQNEGGVADFVVYDARVEWREASDPRQTRDGVFRPFRQQDYCTVPFRERTPASDAEGSEFGHIPNTMFLVHETEHSALRQRLHHREGPARRSGYSCDRKWNLLAMGTLEWPHGARRFLSLILVDGSQAYAVPAIIQTPADALGRASSAITMLHHYNLDKEPLNTTRESVDQRGHEATGETIGKEWGRWLDEWFDNKSAAAMCLGPPGAEKWKGFFTLNCMKSMGSLSRCKWRLTAAKAKVVLCQIWFLPDEGRSCWTRAELVHPTDRYCTISVWSVGARKDKEVDSTDSESSRQSPFIEDGWWRIPVASSMKRCHAARSRQKAVSEIPVALFFVVGAPDKYCWLLARMKPPPRSTKAACDSELRRGRR